MTHYAMTYYFLFDTRKDLCTHRSKNSEIVVISAAAMLFDGMSNLETSSCGQKEGYTQQGGR